ncbi:MAG: elongation factor G [Sedimentisphaerales bacterium]|nr:elongation factor G [Sedimentisphaerales bacterium]
MASYTIDDIRNIVLVGHAGSGKTSLAEAILHKTGLTNRLGSVDDKSSIMDADEEEKQRGHSIDSALAHISYKGKEINLIDTPGYPDFYGAAISALPAAETAVLVISASSGIQMNTRKMFQAARQRGMACIIVINKIDSGTDELEGLIKSIQESFGMDCRCANICSSDGSAVFDCIIQESGDGGFIDVGEAHTNLVETIVEADEELMEQYLGGEEISPEKLARTFTAGMINQSLVPIVFTSARNEVGIEALLNLIKDYAPNPAKGVPLKLVQGEGEEQTVTEIPPEPSGSLLGLVCRVSSDPKSHIKYVTLRLQRGTIKSDTSLQATGGKKGMRSGQVSKLQGDKLDHIDQAQAGDIVTLAKLEELQIRDTVFVGQDPGTIEVPRLPIPMYSLAIEPKSRGDEGKISSVLTEVCDADPTFKVDRDHQTNETVVSGLGELHVRVILSRMHARRGLDVITKPPKIPYRETITSSAKYVEYTHKKQTGGAGQFARVFIDMEPNELGAGYEFIDKIFGGSIDQPFRPSVDKGCQAAMAHGVLAGCPVVDIKVTLVDGKTHPVDSKDIAFQIAGREVFRKAFMQCNPTLLEPIVNIEVTVPAEKVGDITGDLAGRRGRVQGQDVLPGNMITIKAQVPLAEIQQYSSQLKSVTGGQGSFTMELSHYEPMPPNILQQVVAQAKAQKEKADE